MGQALAKGIQAVGLGLQAADAGGDGIDLALGVLASGGQVGLLLLQLVLQAGDFGLPGAVGATGQEAGAEAQAHHRQQPAAEHRGDFRVTEGKLLRRPQHLGYDDDVHHV